MRFAKNGAMDRCVYSDDFLSLFAVLVLRKDIEDGVCTKHFNDIRKFGAMDFEKDPDPDRVKKWLPAKAPDRIDES